LVTPTLGVASATSVNKVALTAPATSATLTLANGSTLATSGAFSQTLTATATTAVTLPTSGYLIGSVTQLGANPVTGTPSSTTYLRGDGTWATVSGGGGSGTVNSGTQYQLGYYATTGTAISGNSGIVTDANGNLGLGTTPSAWGSGRPVIEMNSSGAAYIVNNNTGSLSIQNNSYYNGFNNVAKVTGVGSSYAQYQGSHLFYSIASVSAGATQTFTQTMTLDSSGNLGLGVTPSAWTVYKALQVNGSVFASSGASTAFIGSNWFYDGADKYIASNYATIYRQNAGSHAWLTAPSGTAGNAITFSTAMTLDTSGNLTLGTSNAGIIFNNSSALTNSTLNDYETGIWTPTISAGLTAQTNYSKGKYTKVGNMVSISFPFRCATTSGTTAVSFSLPFTSASTGSNWSGDQLMSVFFDSLTQTGTAGLGGYVPSNSTTVNILKINANVGTANCLASDVPVNGFIFVNITYLASF